MNLPPRRIGKNLIGKVMLLRIAIGTVILVLTTVGSVHWVTSWNDNGIVKYTQNDLHSQALNTLVFGAISICISARFSLSSSLHPLSFLETNGAGSLSLL